MNGVSVEQVLRESSALGGRTADRDLEQLRQAVLVEDVFGIVLSDDQITDIDLSDPEALGRLVAESFPSS